MNSSTSQIKGYLQRNWFKIGIAVLLVFIALKKDLSFKINLNTPIRNEEYLNPTQPVEQSEEQSQRERYTDASPSAITPTELPATERFDFTASGSRRGELAIDRLAVVQESNIKSYIARFDQVAINERRKYGIPSSIILANALLQSQAGTNERIRESHNHFGLKCTPDWRGASLSSAGTCFRSYTNAWTSFRDHSLFITTGAYSHLRQLPEDDYRGWAVALEKMGLLEEKDLARQLMRIIERYELDHYDRL